MVDGPEQRQNGDDTERLRKRDEKEGHLKIPGPVYLHLARASKTNPKNIVRVRDVR